MRWTRRAARGRSAVCIVGTARRRTRTYSNTMIQRLVMRTHAKLHRAADRLRRLLADSDSRSLFFHLETNASPHGSRRQRFVMDSIATYDTLRGCTANFAMLALRCVTANDHGISGIREGGADAYDNDGHGDGSITAREVQGASASCSISLTRMTTSLSCSRLTASPRPSSLSRGFRSRVQRRSLRT